MCDGFCKTGKEENNDLSRQAIWALRVALPIPAPEPFENKPQFLWAFFFLTHPNYPLGKAVLLKYAERFKKCRESI